LTGRNLLLTSDQTARHPSADTTDCTGVWVCVGLSTQLTEVGTVLPATIGTRAVHVVRTATGLVAAYNARPFGGCTSIPAHCASTKHVRCPHLACAFSADTGVIDASSDPDGIRRAEFLGDGRRTVRLPLAQRGPLLFVNVTLGEPPPLPELSSLTHRTVTASGSRLVPGNWTVTPTRMAAESVAAIPNLALTHGATATFAVFSRPAGHTRSTLVWALLG
jgi:nitrite reductase/ring-hydroxylating ferredoxin subunit